MHHISANSHTCGYDEIVFVESMSSLEVTLTLCLNLGFLSFFLPKIGGCTKIRSQLVKNFSFDNFWYLTKSKSFFQFQGLLKWRQHCGITCFCSRKHHLRILALSSLLVSSVLHVPFWLSLIAHHRRYQCKSQRFVPVCTHSISRRHYLAILTRLLSGFVHVLLTTSIFVSIVEGIRESIFSISYVYTWAVLYDYLRSW